VQADACHRLWRYLVEGGAENCGRALAFAGYLIGEGGEPPPALALPRAGYYVPRQGVVAAAEALARLEPSTPVAALIFYRALLDGGMCEPIDALAAALTAQGLAPLPLFA